MKLSKQALNVLKILKEDKEKTVNEFENDGFDQSMVNRALLELEQESLVKSEEDEHDIVEITDKGEEIKESCSPEYSILNQLSDGSKPISELEGDTNIGIGKAKEKNWINIEDGVVSKTNKANELNKDPVKCKLEQENFDDELKRRGLVESDSAVSKTLKLTEKGEEVDLTEVEEDFNVESEVGRYEGGKEHVLRGTANRVKDVLVGMGFQEMDGPHVDSQFWINDCLFMPQDHPARTHWDQFALDLPSTENLPQNLVDKVRSAHKNGVGKYGEGYHAEWNQEVAESIDLRGHTTSLTMRHLSGYQKGSIEPPAKYFSVEKVYRNDTIDSTHLLEFFQIEGWVMAENLSAKDLMGTFKEFYSHFGIEEIEFKPHYNPYTEPSFELFGKHPETGEMIEIGNSGIFRKEVLEPLGVECDVMAWGLALERLLMLMYGFEDIRDVHGTLCDLELLRNTKVVK